MLRFGIIGTSWITDSYIEGALDSGLWQFTAIYSRTEERGLDFGKKYGVTNIYTDITAMAECDDIDAVYIASPNYLHVKHCEEFLKNKKHVICEKPLASHVSEVIELQKTAADNGVIFLEAIMFMHLPMKNQLAEAMGKIGNISMAKFDFCQRSSKYDSYLAGNLPNIFNPAIEAGALMDLGVYCVYPALYFFGEPESVSIDVRMLESGVDGAGVVNFRYPDKLVSIPYSKLGQAAANTDIQGDYGTVYVESISRLANIEILYSNGVKEPVCGDEEKYKLMGYEAIDFYKYITQLDDPEVKKEYDICSEMSVKVTAMLEKLRKLANIKFPSDNW